MSFLPAAGESVVSPPPVAPKPDDRAGRDDGYTYHHLRRDIFGLVGGTGVDIASRYVVPSAHMTLGRMFSALGYRASAPLSPLRSGPPFFEERKAEAGLRSNGHVYVGS